MELGIRHTLLARPAIPADLESARHGLTALRASPRILLGGRRLDCDVFIMRRWIDFHRFRLFFRNFFKDPAAGPADFQVVAVL
jgi:hypothetical protein